MIGRSILTVFGLSIILATYASHLNTEVKELAGGCRTPLDISSVATSFS